MSPVEKATILAQVESQSRRKRQALLELGIPRSTYYRWRQGQPESRNGEDPGTGSLLTKSGDTGGSPGVP